MCAAFIDELMLTSYIFRLPLIILYIYHIFRLPHNGWTELLPLLITSSVPRPLNHPPLPPGKKILIIAFVNCLL